MAEYFAGGHLRFVNGEWRDDNGNAIEIYRVRHGRWEDGRCSNCKEEAVSTSFDEPIYDYDWEENLRYSHTETHTEYHLTNYCPNCGCKMDLEG